MIMSAEKQEEEQKEEKEIVEIQSFTMRLPVDFLFEYDLDSLQHGFATRAEAIRAAIREQVTKWKREKTSSKPKRHIPDTEAVD